jgi:adenosylcobyric acid synthase
MGWHLDAEDAVAASQPAKETDALRVLVPVTPRISNHTDFDPLRLHPQVDLRFVRGGEERPPADLIVLPGSKSVRADLGWLRREGWDRIVARHLRYGGRVIGICGGMQMLGTRIADPLGLEGAPGDCAGLGLLDFETDLAPEKTLRNVAGRLTLEEAPVAGYEIHAGVTTGAALGCPVAILDSGRTDGAISADGQILATYIHGLFESPDACAALLRWAGLDVRQTPDYRAQREVAIERLADTVERHLDLGRIEAILDADASGARKHSFGAATP